MRTIDATLLTNQKSLGGLLAHTITIGAAPNTIEVSAYLLAYDYQEKAHAQGGLTTILDNSSGYFNTLTGDKAYITPGAAVELKRGLNVAGAEYLEGLPTCWLESYGYEYGDGQAPP